MSRGTTGPTSAIGSDNDALAARIKEAKRSVIDASASYCSSLAIIRNNTMPITIPLYLTNWPLKYPKVSSERAAVHAFGGWGFTAGIRPAKRREREEERTRDTHARGLYACVHTSGEDMRNGDSVYFYFAWSGWVRRCEEVCASKEERKRRC